ncbi:MAG TPA: two-component regulator propeller domain-containing protein, partial [Chitinophagaceae bacterium]
MTFQPLTINDGLSQGMINQIIQDRYGFMWFATKDGLNRYDGYHFKIYRHDTEDTSSIASSFVQALFEDSKGRIWAGTSSGCVDYFDHASGKFIHIISEKNSILNGPVQQILEDKQGNVWILSSRKLMRATMPDKVIREIELPALAATDVLNGGGIADLLISDGADMYLYNTSSNAFYFSKFPYTAWERHTFPPPYGGDNGVDKQAVLEYGYRILEDKNRQIVYAVCANGIYKLNNGNAAEQVLDYSLFPTNKAFIDKEGNIWVAQSGGLGVYHAKTGQFSFIVSADEKTQAVLQLLVSAYVDQSGMTWIGSAGYGLLTLNYQAHHFHHTERSSVFNFFERDDGRILVNNGGDELKVLDPRAGVYIDTIPLKDLEPYYEKESQRLGWYVKNNTLYNYIPGTTERKSYPLP